MELVGLASVGSLLPDYPVLGQVGGFRLVCKQLRGDGLCVVSVFHVMPLVREEQRERVKRRQDDDDQITSLLTVLAEQEQGRNSPAGLYQEIN
ncbi:hypothetical protein ASPWEDRAFT_36070 [Aspergillus wentii DTO 134E9]|uniref:Uncharacterized protein n=1 Tax=Aspergillus wentii DTO 134E9 TaxID=1073089 RepID=A0A1L9RUF1_ASPWE|nr:uncharacterized protein ASPWEDRAFT_36070 [Aspergillus wentii DTO 134E9]OJJ38447.1 hypothetical protein ASPWEDRAFT_36070 [Aspergillus wentii DTO 134E9]